MSTKLDWSKYIPMNLSEEQLESMFGKRENKILRIYRGDTLQCTEYFGKYVIKLNINIFMIGGICIGRKWK